MARTPFKVEVLTPDGEVFNDEVEMLSTRTVVGSIGILANHQPLLAMLDPAGVRLYKREADSVRLARGEGYLRVRAEGGLVLVQDAADTDSLNTSDLQEKLWTAEQDLEQA